MRRLNELFRTISSDQRGVTAVEYGLVLALIAAAMLGALSGLSGSVSDRWQDNADQVVNATKN